MNERLLRLALPVLVLVIAIVLWGAVVRIEAIPPYVLPSPGLVASTLVSDGPLLMHSLWVTLVTTLEGFALAAIGGIGLAVLFSQSRAVEYSLYPYAVILQVTPVVAVAPLLLIYLPQHRLLIEADAYTPGPPNSPPPAVVNANNLNLVQNIERLGLQVDRILPLHGRVVPYGELLAAVGRKS